MTVDKDKIAIRDGMGAMDFEQVTRMLASTHWSPGIGIDEVRKGAENSALVVGAFDGATQIGYARVISDKTRFAYILDVIVDSSYRNAGIGHRIMAHIQNHESLTDVYQWMLRTTNARSLYLRCGFVPLLETSDILEIKKSRALGS